MQKSGRCPAQAMKGQRLDVSSCSSTFACAFEVPFLPWRSTKSYAFGWIGAEGSFDEGDKDSRCFRRGAANGKTNVLSVLRVERRSSPRTRSRLFHRNVAISPSRWPV